MKKLLIVFSLIAIVTLPAMAQANRLVYGGWDTYEAKSRNIPAGTVVDPGSQLNFIVDTGVNLLRPTQFTGAQLAGNTVLQLTGITGKGESIQTNFIAVTNTHPTQAVTLHVRYYNAECADVLDYLVLLTCNDTLIFNPFDFIIPGQTAVNAGAIIFGPDPIPGVIPAIPAGVFGSGRFLIQITASGASTDADDFAEILFPFELGQPLAGNVTKCTNIIYSTTQASSTVGATPGGVNINNLHAFNAAAINFNHLIGHHTVAVPKGFIEDAVEGVDQYLAYGVNAWSRPAVDVGAFELSAWNIFGRPDGDGQIPADGPEFIGVHLLPRILTGTEVLAQANRTAPMNTNFLYLRNDVHGGDTRVIADRGKSEYGAMGWTSIHPGTLLDAQYVDLLSVVDDYNGSGNPAAIRDFSYNVDGAETIYVIQIYDYKEQLFKLPPGAQIPISPIPPQVTGVFLNVIVDCLQTWVSQRVNQLEVDSLSLADLALISPNILAGGGGTGFTASFAGLAATHDPLIDASNGWIRFVRWNEPPAERFAPTGDLLGLGGTTELTARSQPVVGVITPLLGTDWPASFLTIGQVVLRFEGFGASWWMPAVAHDLVVAETGDVTVVNSGAGTAW